MEVKVHKCQQVGETVDVLIRPDDVIHDDDAAEHTAIVVEKAFRGAEFLYIS